MNPRCFLHNTRHCQVCAQDHADSLASDVALAELRRRLSGDWAPKDDALKALQRAVSDARRMGLSVTCEVTESVVTTL